MLIRNLRPGFQQQKKKATMCLLPNTVRMNESLHIFPKMDLLIVSASSLLKQICLKMAILIMTSEVEAGSDEKMPPPSRKH